MDERSTLRGAVAFMTYCQRGAIRLPHFNDYLHGPGGSGTEVWMRNCFRFTTTRYYEEERRGKVDAG